MRCTEVASGHGPLDVPLLFRVHALLPWCAPRSVAQRCLCVLPCNVPTLSLRRHFYAQVLRFVLMVNKQGQTRLAQYYETHKMDERCALEAEVIRKCLARTDMQCSFYEYLGYKIVYRRYASLFFIVGVEGDDENELAILEFIHALVETLDRYFENVVSKSTCKLLRGRLAQLLRVRSLPLTCL